MSEDLHEIMSEVNDETKIAKPKRERKPKAEAKQEEPEMSKLDKQIAAAESKSSKVKAEKKPKTKKVAKAKSAKEKKVKPAKEKKAQKASKEKAPLGLRADGEPRVRKEFDPETTMGQKGKKIAKDDFEPNDNEAAVLTVVKQCRTTIKLTDLAEKAFPQNYGKFKRSYYTRNALRRLIRARLVKKVGRGEYEAIRKAA